MRAERREAAVGDDVAAVMAPRGPSEDLSFEGLAVGYHFGTIADRRRVFARAVIGEIERRRTAATPVTTLDIGCGRGIGRSRKFQRAIRAHTDLLWGVEPDATVVPEEGMFDRYANALLEDAALPESSVDVAYSFMVMEHVLDPVGFMHAVRRALKPGGVHMFMTVNGRHYFTKFAKALHSLRLDDAVLRVVNSRSDEYHYPVAYRCNTERAVREAAGEGWSSVEFAYCEADSRLPYTPGPLRVVDSLSARRRRRGSDPTILLNMLCRMRKASS